MADLDREWECLPIAELRQLDDVCVQFEQALAHDPDTAIAPFIANLPESQQRLAVRELVRVTIETRHAHGRTSDEDQYAKLFPLWADELRELTAESIQEMGAMRAATDTIRRTTSADSDTQSAHIPRARLPESLGHYQIQELIGRGGMGLVVRARDTRLQRDVAIKFLSPGISHQASVIERFAREARAVAGVRHKHVVTIHAVEEIDGIPFLVMELVDGTSLEEHLRKHGRLPAGEVAALASQIAQGLAAAHRNGLVHRDVKPANILLENNDQLGKPAPQLSSWTAKLTDFGMARLAAEAGLTGAGQIGGTPQYMSPEQANGQVIDGRSDLFSLGSVMYAMCAGGPPFEADSPIAITRLVADKPARSLREVSPETPDWLIHVIERLMAKSPADRFQSAAELVDDLDCHLPDYRVRPPSKAADHEPAANFDPGRVGWRRVTMAGAIAVGILGVMAVLSASLFDFSRFRRDSSRDQHALTPTRQADRSAPSSDADLRLDEAWHGWPAGAPAPAIAPLAADQLQTRQAAWARQLNVPVETSNSLGMQFQLIPPGEFLMGCSENDLAEVQVAAENRKLDRWYIDRFACEGPQHYVTLTRPFAMSKHEVTLGQFRQFIQATGYRTDAERDGRGGEGWQDGKWTVHADFRWNTPLGFDRKPTDDHPVVNVSWNDAAAFCRWLSEEEQVNFRLPTEAEWEYACRAGSRTPYSFGDDESRLKLHSWHLESSGRGSNAVGQKAPNALGLFDLYGNVFEWCQDTWSLYSKSASVDPMRSVTTETGAGVDRVLRGGSFRNMAIELRSTFRRANRSSFRNAATGFRVVRQYDAAPPPPAIAPFTAEQANAHQSAWARHLGVPIEYTNLLGMKLRLVPPGEFMMGATPGEMEQALRAHDWAAHWETYFRSEQPQHLVVITQPFYLGVHEVTQAQYTQLMGTNPSYFASGGLGAGAVAGRTTADFPVEMVDWFAAREFCNRLSQREELAPAYVRVGKVVTLGKGPGYRFPSEAQWEFACRAGTTTRFWAGEEDEDLHRAGWFSSNSSGRTHVVGGLQANPFGLHDMHGNVWEWVQDFPVDQSYTSLARWPAIDPLVTDASDEVQHIIRGGNWSFPSAACRSAFRPWHQPRGEADWTGFRVSLSVEAVRRAQK